MSLTTAIFYVTCDECGTEHELEFGAKKIAHDHEEVHWRTALRDQGWDVEFDFDSEGQRFSYKATCSLCTGRICRAIEVIYCNHAGGRSA